MIKNAEKTMVYFEFSAGTDCMEKAIRKTIVNTKMAVAIIPFYYNRTVDPDNPSWHFHHILERDLAAGLYRKHFLLLPEQEELRIEACTDAAEWYVQQVQHLDQEIQTQTGTSLFKILPILYRLIKNSMPIK